jgi:TRAP-type C4-dicarboxylate transport system substrate-binding protein
MRLVGIALVAVGMLLGTVRSAPAEVIKIGTLAPEGSPWHDAILDLAAAWKQLSGGKVELRIYPGGVAGDEPDMVRKMRIGQLQAAALSGAGLQNIAQEVQALQMPMMFRSNAELDYVRERIAPKLEAILEKKGFKVLNWADAGWVMFFTRQPVVRPADLKPLKIFAWAGDTCVVDAWRDSGYQPVPLAATDIYTGLETGLISALPTTPIAALSYQWFGLAPHMTDLKWAPLIGATVISTRAWDKIPDDLKPVLLKAAREAGENLQPQVHPLEDKAVAAMLKHGLVVHAVPPEIAAEWEKSARAGYGKIIGCMVPRGIVAEVEKLRDAYRASVQGQ